MTVADLRVKELIEKYHLALGEFMKGDPEPAKRLWSHREDVSLANPQGSVARGWDQVAEAMDRAASSRREGKFVGSEIVTRYVIAGLAYVVEVERLEAKVHGAETLSTYDLRVTMIFRPDDAGWKVVHRQADQLTTAQPPASAPQD
jgi:ketosteroid isomerase-like protein